jgi:hypothetical protein
MGNLFSRGQQISEIKALRFAELKMWNVWHELMADQEAKATCSKCGKTYDVRKQKKCTCGRG